MVHYAILSWVVFNSLSAKVVHVPEIAASRSHTTAQVINYQDPTERTLGKEGSPPALFLKQRYEDTRTDVLNKDPSSWRSRLSGVYSPATSIFNSIVNFVTAVSAPLSAAEYVTHRYQQMSQLRSEISSPDKHSAHTAHVMHMLPEREQMILKSRAAKVRSALRDFLGESVEEQLVPSIGLACGGGGVRALLETVGWLSGAQASGLYDCLTYMSGLSGSTWALNTYLASARSMGEYKEHLKKRLAVSVTDHVTALTSDDLRDFIKALGCIYYNRQKTSVVTIYGILLAQILLKGLVPNPYEMPLSALIPHLHNHPFPLSTAVLGGEVALAGFKHHPSYEFSPVSAGSFELRSHVPLWAFGRVFQGGVSQCIIPNDLNHPEIYTAQALITASTPVLPESFLAPGVLAAAAGAAYLSQSAPSGPYYGSELPLSFYLGVCGSAFSANMHNAVRELYLKLTPASCPQGPEATAVQTEQLRALALALIKQAGFRLPQDPHLDDPHFGAACVPNPTFELAHAPLAEMPNLPLVDAGFEMLDGDRLNSGTVPLLYRRSDVIIIFDSSQDLEGAPSLRAAARLAQALNIPYPSIPATVPTAHIQLFADDNLEAPLILYMPGIANRGFDASFDPQTAPWTATTNFTYTPEQSTQLMDLISHTLQDHQTLEVIKRTVRLAIERKKERAARGVWPPGCMTKKVKSHQTASI